MLVAPMLLAVLSQVHSGRPEHVHGAAPALVDSVKGFGRPGYGILYDRAEVWVQDGLIVVLTKAPFSCLAEVLKHTSARPELWFDGLLVDESDLPSDPSQAKTIVHQRIVLIVESPRGLSCGWRVLQPALDAEARLPPRTWYWRPDVRESRSLGSCHDAADALAVAGASALTVKEVRASLARPGSLSECSIGRDAQQ